MKNDHQKLLEWLKTVESRIAKISPRNLARLVLQLEMCLNVADRETLRARFKNGGLEMTAKPGCKKARLAITLASNIVDRMIYRETK